MNGDTQVMLVVGGTGSIGGEIVRQALDAGWSVIVQGREAEKLDTFLQAMASRCSSVQRVRGIKADITDGADAVEAMVQAAAGRFGRLDAVVDCLVTGPAQGGITGAFESTDPRAYLPFAELSIVYLERLAFAVLPWLKKTRGCLVTLASDAALFPAPRQTLLGAARAAAVGFVKNLAVEVARDGVRVHCVSPCYVEGTATARRLEAAGSERLARARKRAGLGLPGAGDIAPLVLFLCGDGARRMTGQVISVNGGLNV